MDVKVLQIWDSQKLRNPSISLMGFLAGIADGAAAQRPTQVRSGLGRRQHPSAQLHALIRLTY